MYTCGTYRVLIICLEIVDKCQKSPRVDVIFPRMLTNIMKTFPRSTRRDEQQDDDDDDLFRRKHRNM
jgi:hypothetical protein